MNLLHVQIKSENQSNAATLSSLLRERGYRIVDCVSISSAVDALREMRFDLVVFDLDLRDADTCTLLQVCTSAATAFVPYDLDTCTGQNVTDHLHGIVRRVITTLAIFRALGKLGIEHPFALSA